ncbi:MAG TPA: glycosyltransferase [Chloroflexia bacterium]|jgi:glycosyltransferase involved in cell wall biosynthesis
MPISLIMTVRNEASSITRLLDSIAAQTLQPDEIVIADGGSTDGTQEVVTSYTDRLPIRLLVVPGANISEGRNAAIRNASHDIIAATDAGVRLEPGWLQALVGPLLDEGAGVDVVSGFFLPDPQMPFEMAMGATVLPAVEDIDPDKFLPSSRSVAFRKAAWEAVGGYPEWLDYSEDLVFDLRLKELGYRFVFMPEARVHFRPRSSLRAFFLQYYRYARGDGKADLWRKRHGIRYATYVVGPVVAVWTWRGRRSLVGKALFIAMGMAAAGYCRRPYMRLLPLAGRLPLASRLYVLALVPVIRLTGDVAKMLGYPVGVWWRIKHRPPKRPQ